MRIAVVGLGRFGTSLVRELHSLGHEVTAIDLSEKSVAAAADFATLVVQGDGADEEVLLSLNVDRSTIAVVAVGEHVEVSLLATLLLKRIGVPWVVAKAVTLNHAELLARVGADRVVFPEIEAGVDLAHSIGLRQVTDYIYLSGASGVAKLNTPAHLVGRSAAEVEALTGPNLHLLLIVRANRVVVFPTPDERIMSGDELLVVGHDDAITALTTASAPADR